MPQPRQIKVNISKRIQKWKSENPSLKITQRMEHTTESLLGLVELMIPSSLTSEIYKKARTHLDAVLEKPDHFENIKNMKVEACDEAAGVCLLQFLAKAEQIGFDQASPLSLPETMDRFVTEALVGIGKVALCFGYDVNSDIEFANAVRVLETALCLGLAEKKKSAESWTVAEMQSLDDFLFKSATFVSRSISKRRTLASIPSVREWVGGSSVAWVFRDVSNAASNLYAERFLADQALKKKQAAEEKQSVESSTNDLPKAA